MDFVILTQYYPPETGAPQARLSDLAKRLVAAGHRVTVLTGMPNYPTGRIQPGYSGFVRREERDGARVIRTWLYATKDAGFVRRMTNYLSFVLTSAIVGTFLLPRGGILLVESPPLFLAIAGVWLSRLKGTKLVLNVSDLWPESVVRLGRLRDGSRAHRLMVALEEFCYRRSWLITGQSRGILADIQARFPAIPQFHLSNGVDPEFIGGAERSDALRAELGGGKSCLAVYAGLHGLAQGLDQLLDAADRLRDLTDLVIVLIGDGPEKERLQERAARMSLPNVVFRDAVPRDRMPAVVMAADLMLAPLTVHLPGAVPSKIYEAMGGGVPLILIADGEPAEIVRNTGCGLVCPMNDPDALAAAVRRLTADPALRSNLGEHGRRAAAGEYNRDRIASSFMEFLASRS